MSLPRATYRARRILPLKTPFPTTLPRFLERPKSAASFARAKPPLSFGKSIAPPFTSRSANKARLAFQVPARPTPPGHLTACLQNGKLFWNGWDNAAYCQILARARFSSERILFSFSLRSLLAWVGLVFFRFLGILRAVTMRFSTRLSAIFRLSSW